MIDEQLSLYHPFCTSHATEEHIFHYFRNKQIEPILSSFALVTKQDHVASIREAGVRAVVICIGVSC